MKWYQEPLVHFLVLGIFLFFITQNNTLPMVNQDSKTINIQKKDIEKLIIFWKNKYHKNPTQDELDTLIKFYIENEILYAEAIKMKLDEHDEAIKQLLINKLKYIVSEPINIDNITDKELQTFFNENKELFIKERDVKMTFSHIFFNPKIHHNYEEKAQLIYNKIKNKDFDETFSTYGDVFFGGSHFPNITIKELSNYFSHSFRQKLLTLPKNSWSIPIKSGYGIHIVYIKHIKHISKTFTQMKEAIKNRYIIENTNKNFQKYLQDIKKQYKIIQEPYLLKEPQQ